MKSIEQHIIVFPRRATQSHHYDMFNPIEAEKYFVMELKGFSLG